MSLKKAFLFGNGSYDEPLFYKEILNENRNSQIIAVDGGLNFLEKINVAPDLIIGDLDSAKNNLYKKYPEAKLIRHPVKKDETDSELSLSLLTKEGVKDIVMFGMLGSRIDHSLSNLFLLEQAALNGINLRIKDSNNEIFCLVNDQTQKYDFEFKPGTTVSLISLTDEVKDLTLEGFNYPLKNYTLKRTIPGRGVSNIVKDSKQSISFSKGSLLIDVVSNPI